jgi:hypothetical protein
MSKLKQQVQQAERSMRFWRFSAYFWLIFAAIHTFTDQPTWYVVVEVVFLLFSLIMFSVVSSFRDFLNAKLVEKRDENGLGS